MSPDIIVVIIVSHRVLEPKIRVVSIGQRDSFLFALACLHADIATVRGVGATREKGVKESSGTSIVQRVLCNDFE
jgi:hypothetical protein